MDDSRREVVVGPLDIPAQFTSSLVQSGRSQHGSRDRRPLGSEQLKAAQLKLAWETIDGPDAALGQWATKYPGTPGSTQAREKVPARSGSRIKRIRRVT